MRAAAIVWCMAAAGCDNVFGFDDVDPPPVDAAPPEPYVTCTSFEPVLASAPSQSLIEPGIHVDGLRMVVRVSGATTLRELRRANPTSPFATESLSAFPPGIHDASFVSIEDRVYGFGAQPPSPRRIVICPDPSNMTTCTPISMVDENGVELTTDIDGVSVALRDGRPVMAFNHEITVYIAEPESADLMVWRSRWVQEAGVNLDDPVLTRDSRILLMPWKTGGLRALRWDDAAQNYVQPTPVSEIGDSPEIGVETETELELFVTLTRDGGTIAEPHVTTCTRR